MPGRSSPGPPTCTGAAFGAANPCAGSWQVEHAIRPDADSVGSRNRSRPRAAIAVARAYAGAAGGVAPQGSEIGPRCSAKASCGFALEMTTARPAQATQANRRRKRRRKRRMHDRFMKLPSRTPLAGLSFGGAVAS